MGEALLSYLSEADYLAGEELPGLKHEYVRGEIYAMGGATKAHGTIALNIASRLRTHLRGTPCRAWIADMKVHINTARAYYYPDVVVSCNPDDLAPESPKTYLEAPTVVVEVLSNSTEHVDRREKWMNYRLLASLQEYVLIDQERQWVEVFRRNEEGWLHSISQPGEVVNLRSLELSISMDEIYEDTGVDRDTVKEEL